MAKTKKTDQEKDTAPAPETLEQTVQEPEQTVQEPEQTTQEPEQIDQKPEQTAQEPEQTAQEPEQDEDAATDTETQERDLFAGIPNPCVYCGPTVRGVARQYTTYQGGIPDTLRSFITEHPEARQLIVSASQFPAYRRRLDTPGTAEAKLYKRIKEQL